MLIVADCVLLLKYLRRCCYPENTWKNVKKYPKITKQTVQINGKITYYVIGHTSNMFHCVCLVLFKVFQYVNIYFVS